MNTESLTCRVCPIKEKCHPKLEPEKMDKNHDPKPIPNNHEFPITACRHFTCEPNGMPAAVFAVTMEELSEYVLANGETVNAVAFGSFGKQTDREQLRIVSENRRIFSRSSSNGKYYPTGQYAT